MNLSTLERINAMLAKIYPLQALPTETQVQLLAARLTALAGDNLPTDAASLSNLYKAMLGLQDTDARVSAWLMQLAVWQDGEAGRMAEVAAQTQQILATQFQQQLQQHSVDENQLIADIKKQVSGDAAGYLQMFAQLKDVDLGDAAQLVQLFSLVAALTSRVDAVEKLAVPQRIRKPLPSLLASALADVVVVFPKPYDDLLYTVTGLVFEVPSGLNLLQITGMVRTKTQVTLSIKNLSLTLGTPAGTIHLTVQHD